VRKELEGYLDCGLLCRGFARLRCDGCEETRLVAFSCTRHRRPAVIFHALDYAASLGFAPHRDFVVALVGTRPETLVDTPLARPERPIFVPGPDDDVARIVRVLTAKVGTGFSLGGLSGGVDVGEEQASAGVDALAGRVIALARPARQPR
jgi:hypothetical protein